MKHGNLVCLLLTGLLVIVPAFAGDFRTLNYQGRILKPDGSPLETNANFQYTIKSSSGCVLWSETHFEPMAGAKGTLSREVGSGTNQAPGGHSFETIFINSGTLTGLTGCAGGTYTPNGHDDRTLHVSFNDGSGTHSLPSLPIRAVPFSHFSGIAKTALQIRDVDISANAPTNGQVLQFNGTLWEPTTPSAGGSVTSVGLGGSSIFNITGGPITTSGTINLALASQAANLILASPDGSAGVPTFRALLASDIPTLDAAKVGTGTFALARIPSLDASKIVSGTLSAAVGGTGLVPAAGDANKVYAVNAAGTGTEFKSIVQGSGISVDTSVAGQITIAATNSGSVTNVGLTMPSIFSVANSPVTGAGTMNVTLANASQNAVFAGPSSGGAGTPSFRALAASDIPGLDASIITAGTFATARLGTIPASLIDGTLGASAMGMVPASNGGTGLNGGSAANGTLLIGNGSGYTLSTLGISNGLTQTLSAGGIALSTNAQTTNSNNTLMMRDGSGGFAAGTATLQGLVLQGLGTVGINTPATANYSLALPSSIGTPGQVLRTDGTSATSWITLPASQWSDSAAGIYYNSGSVAIGRTNAAAALDVNGTMRVTQICDENGSNCKTVSGGWGAGGSVTNVGMIGNSIFNITGSAVTTAGTFNLDLASQNQNLILASPTGSSGTPSFRALAASDIPSIDAAKITSGTFATARLGQIPASLIDGTLASSIIGNIDASQVTTGTFATARVPDLDASKIVTGTLASARLGTLDASKITTGTLAAAVGGTGLVPAAGNANQLYGVNAAGNGTEFKTITNGAGVTVSQSNGTITIAATGSGGTVTNVGLAGDTMFSITGSPISGAGTMNLGWASQNQNLILASPTGSSGTPSFRSLAASDIPNIDAAKITSGTLSTAQIGALDASIVTTGTFATARIPDLDASKIVTGTLASARLGNFDASKITTGTLSAAVGGTGLVPAAGNANQLYGVNAAGNGTEFKTIEQGSGVSISTSNGTITISATGSGGSVTNVGLAMPSIFSVANSPVTTAGTMNVTLANAAQNAVFAGPASGGAGTPSFRGLAASDIPNLAASILTSGTLNTAQIGALDASIITTGTFALARLGAIPASLIDGTLGASAIGMVPAANGGTGLNGGSAANGTLLIGNGSGYTLATMNISNGLSQTLGAGSISLTTNATNNNTASAIVARDPSGNFSAGAIDVTSTGIRGGTAGTATINAPASFTNYTMTLPSSMGSAGQVLSTDGTSALSWVSAPVNGGTILAASGSTGTPGIAFNSDQDTGLWNPGANTLSLSTGGSERLRVDSNGHVGIGTSTPNAPLTIRDPLTAAAYTGAQPSQFGVNDTITQSGTLATQLIVTRLDPSANMTGLQYGLMSNISTASGLTHNVSSPVAGGFYNYHQGSGTVTAQYGVFSSTANSSTGTISGSYGAAITSLNQSSGTVTNQHGIYTIASNSSTGSVGTASGVRSRIANTGAGVINDAMALHGEVLRTAGTINNGYGLYLGNIQATNKWSIYATDATAPSYLAGSLAVGTTAPGAKLSVQGNAAIGTYGTLAAPVNGMIVSGSVGVGTATPQALLDVNGTMRVTEICDNSGNNCKTVSGGWGSGGSVTNVGLSGNSMFSITGSPVTSAGTMNIDWASQNQNLVLASPNGSSGTPSFRALAAADITTGTFALARLGTIPAANGGTGLDGSSAANGQLLIGNGSGYTLASLGISNGLTQTLGAGTIALSTNATNNNTASAIVARDPSGNFSAGAVDVASIGLRGNTTGVLTMNTPASFTNYTLTWPSSAGSAGQVLSTNGTSSLSWVTAPTNGGTFLAASGTAGTPGIAFNLDQDTGLWNPGTNTIAISTGGTERLRINSSGNVGIGTSTFNDAGHTSLSLGRSDGNLYTGVEIYGARGGGSSLSTYQHFFNNSTRIAAFEVYTGSNTTSGDMTFSTASSSTMTEKMRITQGGSVGIGTASPGAKLSVVDSVADTYINVETIASKETGYTWTKAGTVKWAAYVPASSNDLRWWDGSAERVTFKQGGSIGIGTTSPAHLLDVNGDARIGGTIILGTNPHGGGDQFAIYNTTGNAYLYAFSTAGNSATLGAWGGGAGKPLLLNDGGGNVGINIEVASSPPGSALSVAGNAAIGTTYGTLAAPANGLIVSGSVGIGTSSPEALLDVSGSLTTNASTEGITAYTNTGSSYSIPNTSVNIRRLTLTGNATITLPAFTAPTAKVYSLTIFLKQDGTGSRTYSFVGSGSDTVKWDSGTAPTISSTANKITVIQLMKPSDETVWYGSMVWKEN